MADRSESDAARAASGVKVDLADFSTALTHGVLRAVEARKQPSGPKLPVIWAGWMIGEQGPLGLPDLKPGSDPEAGRPG